MIYDCMACGKCCEERHGLYIHVKNKAVDGDKKHKALLRRLVFVDRSEEI